MTYREGTNGIPRELEEKLVEAKGWYDRREELEDTIQEHGGLAERNQDDLDAFDREAGSLLAEIVEAVESTWGFGR